MSDKKQSVTTTMRVIEVCFSNKHDNVYHQPLTFNSNNIQSAPQKVFTNFIRGEENFVCAVHDAFQSPQCIFRSIKYILILFFLNANSQMQVKSGLKTYKLMRIMKCATNACFKRHALKRITRCVYNAHLQKAYSKICI